MPNYKRKILVSISDTHGGHELGLCNPDTKLQGDGKDREVTLNESQLHLWKVMSDGINKVKDLADKDEIIVFHEGDVCQGDKYSNTKMSERMADDIEIAVNNFAPWLSLPNVYSVRLAKGTAAHNFGFGSAEILVSARLRDRYNKDVQVVYHGLCTLPPKFLIDYAHHGPSAGRRNWLQGNEARYYLRDLMYNELQAGHRPPDLVLRGHYHSLVTEELTMRDRGEKYKSMLAITPSMCLLDDFSTKATRSQAIILNGILAFEIINERIYNVHEFCVALDIRTKETLDDRDCHSIGETIGGMEITHSTPEDCSLLGTN